jgi:hypothetical protein
MSEPKELSAERLADSLKYAAMRIKYERSDTDGDKDLASTLEDLTASLAELTKPVENAEVAMVRSFLTLLMQEARSKEADLVELSPENCWKVDDLINRIARENAALKVERDDFEHRAKREWQSTQDLGKALVAAQSQVAAAEQALECARRDALEEAAKACERRAEDRFAEFGATEHDTNFSYYPGSREDELNARDDEDHDCAAAIRALAQPKVSP